ncbi:stage V sporulation protein AA [Halobacillus sp. ACCC02827]|uniref:stage V sporulation protein AA n=1 Tax=Bacillaceae TaxID=186817 RepID=UPI0002A51364|nr:MULTISPECIES: stage V sporulation protein AA [Bacillaceae]ELK44437.1 stage V sporulation protein AA [Halobacillus sp. BAB-2008]QHT46928.1 stage V sporulation protein AA [Bacillus sp. SB49]WJE14152.1 stage V sporulation protein AA [Halobacillus sp. ACCC02827]
MTPIYIRMKQSIYVPPGAVIRLSDIARVVGPGRHLEEVEHMELHQVTKEDQNIVVIDSFMVIEQILAGNPDVEIEMIGPSQCVVHVEDRKKEPSPLLIAGIWILLFIGAAMAIMNFHYDVSMESVQQKLHFMLTGEEEEHPLWIQVPYSIGLGVGMILFFNHWFQKRFNEEPSPMEVEIFNYQEDLDHYVAIKENKVEKQDVDH